MPIDLGPILAQAERLKTVKGSMKAAFLALATKIEDCKNDPAQVQAVADAMRTDVDDIVTDITANTPAATEPPPPAQP